MQNKRSQPEVNRIMPETKLTEIRGLSIDQRLKVSGLYRKLMVDYISYLLMESVVFITVVLLFHVSFLQSTLKYDINRSLFTAFK